jgi:UDP-N-acetylglucosamine 4,6-dehydratase
MSLTDKVVLVTGGTGSFGRKFAATVLARYDVKKLIVFSRDELKQSEMHREVSDRRVRYFIGDVRDLDRLRRAMNGVDIVVHAAAMKQVPACEYNPFEAVKTNIIGGANVIEAAIDEGVEKVMAISTDKAVNPVNLYGATKLCAEKIFVQGNAYAVHGRPRFSCCRYGNVIGSRGSVVPLFQAQRRNGTITVTDARMTRFWLPLERGVDFVLKCLDVMQGGEVFVPKIASMKIVDLAAAIAPGCTVAYTGIRPGEKLHEELVSEDEARHTVELDDMFVVEPTEPYWTYAPRAGGRRLPDGFCYQSETNDRWLTDGELRAMVAEGPVGAPLAED